MTVYLVVGIAFAVELLLLLGAGRLWEGDSSPWRCAAGAGLGALHGAVCMLPGFLFLGSVFWRIVFAFLPHCPLPFHFQSQLHEELVHPARVSDIQ